MNKPPSEKPVLVSVLLVIFGLMWLFWLHKLHTTNKRTSSTDSAITDIPTDRAQDTLRCHQVTPMLRSTLLVFSVFLALSSMYFACRLIVSEEEMDSVVWIRKMIFAMLFLVIFFVQVLYIFHMTKNKQNVNEGCSIHQRLQMYTVGGFAVIQVCVGLYLFMVV